jgi:hypothetical protein
MRSSRRVSTSLNIQLPGRERTCCKSWRVVISSSSPGRQITHILKEQQIMVRTMRAKTRWRTFWKHNQCQSWLSVRRDYAHSEQRSSHAVVSRLPCYGSEDEMTYTLPIREHMSCNKHVNTLSCSRKDDAQPKTNGTTSIEHAMRRRAQDERKLTDCMERTRILIIFLQLEQGHITYSLNKEATNYSQKG